MAKHERVQAAFRAGVASGIIRYAIWKNGEQLVGVMQHQLSSILREVATETPGHDLYGGAIALESALSRPEEAE